MTIIIGDDTELVYDILRFTKADVGTSHLSMMARAERLATRVIDISWQEESSTSRPSDDTSLPSDERGKAVAEEAYEMGSDVDVNELKMMEEGFIQLEIRGHCDPHGSRFTKEYGGRGPRPRFPLFRDGG